MLGIIINGLQISDIARGRTKFLGLPQAYACAYSAKTGKIFNPAFYIFNKSLINSRIKLFYKEDINHISSALEATVVDSRVYNVNNLLPNLSSTQEFMDKYRTKYMVVLTLNDITSIDKQGIRLK